MLRTVLCLAIATLACAADWTVGWKAAADQAAKTKRPILADFSGSDWCAACKLLKQEVFSSPEFAAWAAEKVVLLEVDFPIQTSLPAAQKLENEGLQEKYGIEGFPTVLLLSADGKVLGQLVGYRQEGAKAWIAAADDMLAKAK